MESLDRNQTMEFSRADEMMEKSAGTMLKTLQQILRQQRKDEKVLSRSALRKFVGILPKRAPYFRNGKICVDYIRSRMQFLTPEEFAVVSFHVPTIRQDKKGKHICMVCPSRELFDIVSRRSILPIRRFSGRRHHGGWIPSERREKLLLTRIPATLLSYPPAQRELLLQNCLQKACNDSSIQIVYIDKFREPKQRKDRRGATFVGDTSVRIEVNRDLTTTDLQNISKTPFLGKCLLTTGSPHTELVRCYNCLRFGHQSSSCPFTLEYCVVGHLKDPITQDDLETLLEIFGCVRMVLGIFGAATSPLEDKVTLFWTSEEDFVAQSARLVKYVPQFFRYFLHASTQRQLFCRTCGFLNCASDCPSKSAPFPHQVQKNRVNERARNVPLPNPRAQPSMAPEKKAGRKSQPFSHKKRRPIAMSKTGSPVKFKYHQNDPQTKNVNLFDILGETLPDEKEVEKKKRKDPKGKELKWRQVEVELEVPKKENDEVEEKNPKPIKKFEEEERNPEEQNVENETENTLNEGKVVEEEEKETPQIVQLKEIDEKSALMMACKNKKLEEVKSLMKEGADPNVSNKNGLTALMMVVSDGYLEIAEVLVKNGADTNLKEKMGKNALMMACENEDFEMVKTLVENGADTNERNKDGWTALMVVSRDGGCEVANLLVENGADPNLKDNSGNTALMKACQEANFEMITCLVKNGADVNESNNNNWSVLMVVSRAGECKITKFLIEHGADLNRKEKKGNTALMMACQKQDLKMIKCLIENGANANERNDNGWTALMVVSRDGDCEIAKYLVENGADPNLKENHGNTALIKACQKEDFEMAQCLIEKGAVANERNNNGWTALMVVARNGSFEITKLLIESEADPNLRERKGDTALMKACNKKNVEIAKWLVENGADANVRNKDGWTALMMVVRDGNIGITKWLVKNGADPNLKEKGGNTVLIIACTKKDFVIIKYLVENGADVNDSNKNGWTALMVSARDGCFEIVKFLVDKGADTNLKEKKNKNTPLMKACRKEQNSEMVKFLVENGANTNDRNKDGMTALMMVTRDGLFEMVKLLVENGVNLNLKEKNGNTALMLACKKENLVITKFLVENGAEVNEIDKKGLTPLMVASSGSCFGIAKCLVKNGADPNLKDKNAMNALMRACKKGDFAVAKLLVENDADINDRNNDGCTAAMMVSTEEHFEITNLLVKTGDETKIQQPEAKTEEKIEAKKENNPDEGNGNKNNGENELIETKIEKKKEKQAINLVLVEEKNEKTDLMMACEEENLEMVKFLMQKEEDPNEQDKNGLTALMKVARDGNSEIADFLVENGADPNLREKRGNTAIMIACEKGNFEIVVSLAKNGADVNGKNNDAWTALMIVTRDKYFEIAKFLVENGAEPNLKEKNGNNALMMACQNEDLKMVKCLVENGADVNERNNGGCTALSIVTRDGNFEITEFLEEIGEKTKPGKETHKLEELVEKNEENKQEEEQTVEKDEGKRYTKKKIAKFKEKMEEVEEEEVENSPESQPMEVEHTNPGEVINRNSSKRKHSPSLLSYLDTPLKKKTFGAVSAESSENKFIEPTRRNFALNTNSSPDTKEDPYEKKEWKKSEGTPEGKLLEIGSMKTNRKEFYQMNPNQRKKVIGEQLYPICKSLFPSKAGKICGIIVDSLDVTDLIYLLNDPELLEVKIKEGNSIITPPEPFETKENKSYENKKKLPILSTPFGSKTLSRNYAECEEKTKVNQANVKHHLDSKQKMEIAFPINEKHAHAREAIYFSTDFSNDLQPPTPVELIYYPNLITHTLLEETNNCVTLFGDNDRDFFRPVGENRSFFGGLAKVCGPNDRQCTYGIITCFYDNPTVTVLQDYLPYLDMHYKDLKFIHDAGYSIKVPAPSPEDIHKNPNIFCKEGKQIIFHTIGTGIAGLPQSFLHAIQRIFDRLSTHIRNTGKVDEEIFNFPVQNWENKSEIISQNEQMNVDRRTKLHRHRHSFSSQAGFQKFLEVHTVYVDGAVEPSMCFALMEVLIKEFSPLLANQEVSHGRRTGMRYEMLFGDTITFPSMSLTHSNLQPLMAKKFPPLLAQVGQKVYAQIKPKPTEFSINSCLVNFYPDGEWFCGLHLDDETDHDGNVLLVHLGTPRIFKMCSPRCPPNYKCSIEMNDGDAFFSDPAFAQSIYHGKIMNKYCKKAHCTLTFRNVGSDQPKYHDCI